jgi:hypothetical protein
MLFQLSPVTAPTGMTSITLTVAFASTHQRSEIRYARFIPLFSTLRNIISNKQAPQRHISYKAECFERYSRFRLALVSPHSDPGDVAHEDAEPNDVHTPTSVSSSPYDLTSTFDDLSLSLNPSQNKGDL